MAMEINSVEDLQQLIRHQEAAQSAVEETVAPEPAPAEPETTQKVVEEAPRTKSAAVKEVLSQIVFDINKINVVKSSNPLAAHQELEHLFSKPSYEVIALQSGYRCSMTAFNNEDMIRVRKFTGTELEQNMKLFGLVFNHLPHSSLGKIRLQEWLKLTAEADFETLIYGLYCATFPEESDYSVSCPHCRAENKAKIGKEHLLQVRDDRARGYVQQILDPNSDPKVLVRDAVVNQRSRIILPESKIIVDIVTPTLHDYLESLKNADRMKGFEREIFGYLKNIGTMLAPILQSFAEGRPEFIELEQLAEKAKVIAEISPADRRFLEKSIAEKSEQYKVEYKLPDFNCHSCAGTIENIVIDMTEILFQSMARA